MILFLIKWAIYGLFTFMASTVRVVLRKSVGQGVAALRSVMHGIHVLTSLGKKRIVPAVKNPLLLKSATVLAAEIREGKIKSEDVVRSYIDRIREVEPYINAVVDERFAEAIEEARAVDELIASRSVSIEDLEKDKPLLGVPITVKMLLSVKGMSCTAGCTLFRGRVAEEDAECVMSMKNAGAIITCITNSPEFGLFFETYNHLHGKTSNPYDTTRSSGGSSGGEGAIIGAAGSVLGLGNDIGGSVRFPAFYNCIFSHKPTAGVISNNGTFPVPFGTVGQFLTAGPMCRYVDDLMTSMKILAGAAKSAELGLGNPVNMRHLKICYLVKSSHLLAPKLDDEILQSLKQVLRYFNKNYGIEPQHTEIEEMKSSFDIWIHLCREYAGDKVIENLTCGKADVNPSLELLKVTFGCSDYTIAGVMAFDISRFPFMYKKANVPKMIKKLEILGDILGNMLDDRTVLILPTFPTTATYHNEWLMSSPGVGYTALFNMLGYPATQCPLGLSSNGLPLGIQVVSGKGRDNLTLAVGLEIGKAFGGWVAPGSI